MIKKFAVVAACLTLAGCGTFQAQSRVDPIKIATYAARTNACIEPALPYDRRLGAYNLDCFRFKGETELAYVQAAGDKNYRNRLASFLMNESNTVCTREMGNLTANEAMVNAGLASGTTVLSTVGALVTGQFASNALAAAASGTNAIRGHINSEVYRNILAAAVSKAIRGERDKQRGTIRGKYSKDTADYNVDDMLMDVNQYHQVCSFYRGLDLVITAVDRNAHQSTDTRRAAAIALEVVRGQISALDRRIARPGIAPEEKTELIEQRTALRSHETDLIKQYASVPAVIQNPPPAGEPEPDPSSERDASTNTTTDQNQ